MSRPRLTLAHAVALAAGACDASTGLLLLGAPAFALSLMRVPPVPADATVFLRWVGAFVLSTGAVLLFPFLLLRRAERLAASLEVTALVRAIVAAFVTITVLSGSLAPSWLSVAATDAAFAVLQILALRRGIPPDAA